MRIRLHAEQTRDGVLLSQIDEELNAESVRIYFLEKGIAAQSISNCNSGDYRILLPGTTIESFNRLIRGANIELI